MPWSECDDGDGLRLWHQILVIQASPKIWVSGGQNPLERWMSAGGLVVPCQRQPLLQATCVRLYDTEVATSTSHAATRAKVLQETFLLHQTAGSIAPSVELGLDFVKHSIQLNLPASPNFFFHHLLTIKPNPQSSSSVRCNMHVQCRLPLLHQAGQR